jgi:hypothetical protein
MSFFPDLSTYEYELPTSLATVFTIGWLDLNHPYEQGPTDQIFINALEWCCCNRFVNQMRGTHVCNLCGEDPVFVIFSGVRRMLGSAEIWVPGDDGKIYAAPDLILHYVKKHAYCPPQEFQVAVRRLFLDQTKTDDLYQDTVARALRSLGY